MKQRLRTLKSPLFSTCPPSPTTISIPLPKVDPLNSEGDELYSIYRKGLITRHISSNGRPLDTIGLESIDDFNKDSYDNSGFIDVKRTDDRIIHKIPVDNIRYSEELTGKVLDDGTYEKEEYLWVPSLAPVKYPGNGNDGYYAVSGGGDNPIYYGGMALATFALEYEHGVSPHSIEYARKIFKYFLASEFNKTGYILRRPNIFNSNRSTFGDSIILGASAEELLGLFLGLMYYIRIEPDINLRNEAIMLRDRVLDVVPKFAKGHVLGHPIPDDYRHLFMISSHKDDYYPVSHFAFPYFASRGELIAGSPRSDYLDIMFLISGKIQATVAEIEDVINPIFDSDLNVIPYWTYCLYLTSIVLVLDSDIPDTRKEELAVVFMRDFIKEAITKTSFKNALQNNAYMGVVFKLVNKYLNSQRDPDLESTKFNEIWSSERDRECMKKLKQTVEDYIIKPKSTNNETMAFDDEDNKLYWQHNLPLSKRPPLKEDEDCWKDHNPNNRIGKWFQWNSQTKNNPSVMNLNEDRWYFNFPGWERKHTEVPPALDEMQYVNGSNKKYLNKDYVKLELAGARNHKDNQVEGMGLGLLFLRMLLTEIKPENYPPPNIPDKDIRYKVLPWPAAEPMHLQQFKYDLTARNIATIGGDQDQDLRIISLGDEFAGTHNFIIAYATREDGLRLVPGFVTNGYSEFGQETTAGIYLNSIAKNEKRSDDPSGLKEWRFDKLELEKILSPDNKEFLVVAERAENEIRGPNQHWLRVSLWQIPQYSEGHVPDIQYISKWNTYEDRNIDGDYIKNIDLTILDNKYIVVMHRTKGSIAGIGDKNKIRILQINYNDYSIVQLKDKIVSEDLCDDSIGLATAYKDLILYNFQDKDKWCLNCAKWNGSSLDKKDSTTFFNEDQKLFDIITLKKPILIGNAISYIYYLLAVVLGAGDHLQLYSWEITENTGKLTFKGELKLNKDSIDTLNSSEYMWERASISSFYRGLQTGFVIVGKSIVRQIAHENSTEKIWEIPIAKSVPQSGLKLLSGYILPDGKPTVISSNVAGKGMAFLEKITYGGIHSTDVTSMLSIDDGIPGVVTAHKTAQGELNLIFWRYEDIFDKYPFSANSN